MVINNSEYNIELIIPAPSGSRRSSACIMLPRSGAIDVLPWAGSMENCRRIAQLYDLKYRGLVVIEEENE